MLETDSMETGELSTMGLKKFHLVNNAKFLELICKIKLHWEI